MYKIFFFLFFFNVSSGQTWHKFSDSILVNYTKNKIDKAKLFLDLTEQELNKTEIKIDSAYADFLYRKGLININNEECVKLFNESLRVWEESDNKNYLKIMKIHYFIGVYYYKRKEDDIAIKYFIDCYNINKKQKIKVNPNLLRSLKIISEIYFEKQDFKNADKFADEYIQLNKDKVFIDFDFDFIKMYQYKRNEKTQEYLLLKFLKNYETRKIDNPELLLKINFELLLFYDSIKKEREIYKSISYGEKVLEIYFKHKTNNLSELKLTITILINSYKSIGSTSQELYLKKINEQIFPDNYFDYYYYFDKLDYYLINNDFENFKFYFSEFENELKNNKDLDNLVKIYSLSLDSFERNVLFNKEDIINQFNYLKENKEYFKLKEFYDLYLAEYYSNVEENYNLVIDIAAKNLETENLKLKIGFYFLLINSEVSLNKYSEYRFNELINLLDFVFSTYDHEYDEYLFRLIKIYEIINFKNSSNSILNEKLVTINSRKLEEILDYYTNSEINQYIKSNQFKEEYFLSSLLNLDSELDSNCFEYELLIKRLTLRNQNRIKTSIERSGNAALQSQYSQFLSNQKEISKQNELPLNKRRQDLDRLTAETEQLEKTLTRESALFSDSKKAMSIRWEDIKNKLKPNEAVIDLVAFTYYNKKWTDSIVYAAFVVKKEYAAPKFISLFEQKQLEFLLHKEKNVEDNIVFNEQYSNQAIGELFFKPLEQELKNVGALYLTPTGLAHQINFQALPVSETQTLGEKYKLHLLGSASEIIAYNPKIINRANQPEVVLYGAINYDLKDNLKTEETKSNSDFNELATRSGISSWSYLAGTKTEIKDIEKFSSTSKLKTQVVEGDLATETNFKLLDGKKEPFVLHIATHGFFFPDPITEKQENSLITEDLSRNKIYKTSDNPMMRSGLLFAGANNYWRKTVGNETKDDGIVTASDISNLDLSNCQLAVLSACETGLGDIKGSEGVYGLQRAFKMAGVKNIIMSLWKVPDLQTSELFSIFYKEYFSGKSVHEAFRIAQSEMSKKYEPYFWAGFVLLE